MELAFCCETVDIEFYEVKLQRCFALLLKIFLDGY